MTRQTAIFINVDGGETRLTPRLVVNGLSFGCNPVVKTVISYRWKPT